MRHGFLLIDKPAGPTSHDVVQQIRRLLNESKVGHIGTLDPAASGLLVLAVGAKALKVIELFSGLTKEYEAAVKLGSVSNTYDGDGTIEQYAIKPGVEIPDEIMVRNVIQQRFIGKIKQIPPAHSAVHVAGKRAYELARKGEAVELAARPVEITKCEILSYDYPQLRLRVACGSGTYIRSLAHDLGSVLRVGGYLESLRRTKVGEWSVQDALSPQSITWTNVMPLKEVLKNEPKIELTAEEMEHINHGRMINQTVEENTFAWFEDLPVALMVPTADGRARPRKVL